MVTRIGKLFLCINLIGYFSLLSNSLDITVLSTDGSPINGIAKGVPFILQVSLKDGENIQDEPEIEGIGQLTILNKEYSNNITIINGARTTEKKYIYSVRADKLGTITLGPAFIKSLAIPPSNSVAIEVKDKLEQQTTDSVRYEFIIAKKQAFKGEKVPFIIRFMYSDSRIKLVSIQDPEIKGIHLGEKLVEQTRIDTIKGINYTVKEFHGYFYPEIVGEVYFPALKADYTQHTQHDIWSLHSSFFGIGAKRKQVYSSTQTLYVHPLPPTEKVTDAIGNFTAISLQLSDLTAFQGDAVTLTLTIEGNGNIERIKPPNLHIPEYIKYYESKTTLENTEQKQIKKFEYIVQGLQPGIWEIPAQEFSYFDPEEKLYKTIKSNPVTLKIEPSNKGINSVQHYEEYTEDIPDEFSLLHQRVTEYVQKYEKPEALPLPLFCMLALLPIVSLALCLISNLWQKHQEHFFKAIKVRYALSQARKKIKKAQVQNQVALLYGIFKLALIYHFDIIKNDIKNITDDDIIAALRHNAFDERFIEEWRSFNNELLINSTYAPNNNANNKDLFSDCLRWLNRFKDSKKAIFYTILGVIMVTTFSSLAAQDKKDLMALEDIASLRAIQNKASGNDIYAIEELITCIKKNTSVSSLHPHDNDLLTSIYKKSMFISLFSWQLLFLIIWWSLIIFARLITTQFKVIIVSLLIIVAIGGALGAYNRCKRLGIISKSSCTLYIGPDKSYPHKGQLQYLDDICIIKRHNCWYYVSSPLGIGWVSAQDIKLI